MTSKILRGSLASLVLVLAMSACNKQQEAPPPVTDPAAQAPAAEPAPAPAAEPAPAPEPAPKPKHKPKPQPQASYEPAPQPAAPAVCYDCGTIANITEVRQAGQGSGAGAVLGGVAGGVAGHQIGKGKGNDVATVAGALLGAYAGHKAEEQIRAAVTYDVTIAMESGGSRTINVPALNGLAVGQPVRVDGNAIAPR